MGSGSWYRWSKKTVIEDYRCLNISSLVKCEAIFKCGLNSGVWQWRDVKTNEIKSQLSYESCTLDKSNSFLKICYAISESKQEHNYKIQLDRTNTRFGGQRFWFLCPITGKRVSKLYLQRGVFVSRHAYGLSYASQSETIYDRALRKKHKIQDRLGGEEYYFKPKGMHQKTYDRLLKEFWKWEEICDNHMMQLFSRYSL